MSQDEDIFEGIDGATILQQLEIKISQAKILVTDTALDLDGLEQNPDAREDERELLRRIYRARRFQYEFLMRRKATIEVAASGQKAPTKIR